MRVSRLMTSLKCMLKNVWESDGNCQSEKKKLIIWPMDNP